jgi:cytochrome P450
VSEDPFRVTAFYADMVIRVTGAFPTAAAINVVALHIMSNDRVRKNVLEELRKVDSFPPLPQASMLADLPYFQACINEGLRLSPPITQLRERVVPAGGDTFEGQYMPAGTNIGLNTQGLGRHACFGSDPEIFKPERWLGADAETLRLMKKVQNLIFGYGSTKCPGYNQAMLIITKSVAAVRDAYTYCDDADANVH